MSLAMMMYGPRIEPISSQSPNGYVQVIKILIVLCSYKKVQKCVNLFEFLTGQKTKKTTKSNESYVYDSSKHIN